MGDYQEQMVLSSTTRSLAIKANKEAQRWYEFQYDKTTKTSKFQVGDWVLVYFPQDETGKNRKLSQPWHGPYRIVSRDDPDVTVAKIYFPDDPLIQIHRSHVQHCPSSLTLRFYWYGTKRSKPGRPPKQVLKQLAAAATEMRSPSPIRELEETKTKDAHPDTNNISEKTKSSIASKSTDINLQDTVRPNNYPGSTPA